MMHIESAITSHVIVFIVKNYELLSIFHMSTSFMEWKNDYCSLEGKFASYLMSRIIGMPRKGCKRKIFL